MESIFGFSKDIFVGPIEPYIPSPNITPIAGSVMLGFGIYNLATGNKTAGIIQVCMGVVTIWLGFLIPNG